MWLVGVVSVLQAEAQLLVGVVSVWQTEAQCGDTIEKSQAPDDGCISVRDMLSIEEVK